MPAELTLPHADLFTDLPVPVRLTHDVDRPVMELPNPNYPGWCYPSHAGDCREPLARCGGIRTGVRVNAANVTDRELYTDLATHLRSLHKRYDLAFGFTPPEFETTFQGERRLVCWAFGISSTPPPRPPQRQRYSLTPPPTSPNP